jgi:hypothetical protein
MRFHLEMLGVMATASAITVLTIGLLTGQMAAQELPAAKDTIFARKILMGAIDMNMDEIETMLAPEGKLELADAQEHAETISTMLMAFPHMFPPVTTSSVERCRPLFSGSETSRHMRSSGACIANMSEYAVLRCICPLLTQSGHCPVLNSNFIRARWY